MDTQPLVEQLGALLIGSLVLLIRVAIDGRRFPDPSDSDPTRRPTTAARKSVDESPA